MISANLNIHYMLPEILLFILAIGVLVSDLFLKQKYKTYLWDATFAGLLVIMLVLLKTFATGLFPGFETSFNGQSYADNLSLLFRIIIIVILFTAFVLSVDQVSKTPEKSGIFIFLTIMSALGALIMASAADLIVLLLGLEILSIPLYTLAGFQKEKKEGREASLKYFILGSFASAFLLFGIALIFGICRTTELAKIAETGLTGAWKDNTILAIGVVFLMSTLAFKGGLMPFYAWIPDVYRGSPDFVVGYMAAIAKIAVFGALIRIALIFIPILGATMISILTVLFILTVIMGNLMALWQNDVKRMLAYSSIAHAGYLVLGIMSNPDMGFSSILFYVLIYSFAVMGAFSIAGLVCNYRGGYTLAHFDSLHKDQPLLAVLMTVFLFTLAGIPPLAGFWSKFFLFNSAIESNYDELALIGVIASLIGVYYYIRVMVRMYMHDLPYGTGLRGMVPGMMTKWGLYLASVLVILLGLFPGVFYNALVNLIRAIF
jgi:NADH-quinone oxidoreductase subunit N